MAAGWGMGESAMVADCEDQVRSFGQWDAASCTAPPSVIAGQYATSNNSKLLLVSGQGFPVRSLPVSGGKPL